MNKLAVILLTFSYCVFGLGDYFQQPLPYVFYPQQLARFPGPYLILNHESIRPIYHPVVETSFNHQMVNI